MSGVLAEGTLYVNQDIAGVPQGLERWRGVAKLEIKPNSELKEATSKDKDEYGQIVASVAINKPADLTVVIKEITGRALGMALQGSVSVLAQGSGSATDQLVTAKKGRFVELGKRNVATAGFVVTNSAASVTYVLNTDYRVNYAMGFLEILQAGAITEGQELKVDYAWGAVSGEKVLGATVPQVKGKLVLDGKNLIDGKPMTVTIWEATLTADGPVDFMSDDLIELSMKGRMTTPTGKTSPVEIELGMVFS
ncbi:MAG: hypothetical protein Q8K07_10330 [Methylicorpusculum sp.]|uniref:phage tail tube protein n=1 Tax=Methylicorpusculum sp. TaxID=2713644 RepID=UPI00272F5ABA|nr:hypothetical protein [Methylicorpusculum sp.]MDP2202404.1 hypothetical protein [Methylicorpusculum sp.]